jgi:hypothetical protein
MLSKINAHLVFRLIKQLRNQVDLLRSYQIRRCDVAQQLVRRCYVCGAQADLGVWGEHRLAGAGAGGALAATLARLVALACMQLLASSLMR